MPDSPTPTVMSGTVDLDAIEARAKAATSGTWTALRDDYENGGASDHRIACPSTEQLFYVGDYQNAGADAAHVAGMGPLPTLTLVATIRALEAERDEARTNAANLSDIMARISAERNEAVRGRMALEAERDAMREALKPFAKHYNFLGMTLPAMIFADKTTPIYGEDRVTGDEPLWFSALCSADFEAAHALVHPMAETANPHPPADERNAR